MAPDYGRHHVKSLSRGLRVIRAFSADSPRMTLSDVARETGLDRAASRRFLMTLEDLGYVRSEGRDFMLTPRVLELGYAYLASLALPEIALPHLERLSATLGESCSMSVLDGLEIVYVARVAASRIFALALGVGSRLPAHVTSMGRVLLAAKPETEFERLVQGLEIEVKTRFTASTVDQVRNEVELVRNQGWAIVDQEIEEGLRSVAVPVRDARGTVVAAINVSAHAARTSLKDIQSEFLPELRDTASEIEADLAAGSAIVAAADPAKVALSGE